MWSLLLLCNNRSLLLLRNKRICSKYEKCCLKKSISKGYFFFLILDLNQIFSLKSFFFIWNNKNRKKNKILKIFCLFFIWSKIFFKHLQRFVSAALVVMSTNELSQDGPTYSSKSPKDSRVLNEAEIPERNPPPPCHPSRPLVIDPSQVLLKQALWEDLESIIIIWSLFQHRP